MNPAIDEFLQLAIHPGGKRGIHCFALNRQPKALIVIDLRTRSAPGLGCWTHRRTFRKNVGDGRPDRNAVLAEPAIGRYKMLFACHWLVQRARHACWSPGSRTQLRYCPRVKKQPPFGPLCRALLEAPGQPVLRNRDSFAKSHPLPTFQTLRPFPHRRMAFRAVSSCLKILEGHPSLATPPAALARRYTFA